MVNTNTQKHKLPDPMLEQAQNHPSPWLTKDFRRCGWIVIEAWLVVDEISKIDAWMCACINHAGVFTLWTCICSYPSPPFAGLLRTMSSSAHSRTMLLLYHVHAQMIPNAQNSNTHKEGGGERERERESERSRDERPPPKEFYLANLYPPNLQNHLQDSSSSCREHSCVTRRVSAVGLIRVCTQTAWHWRGWRRLSNRITLTSCTLPQSGLLGWAWRHSLGLGWYCRSRCASVCVCVRDCLCCVFDLFACPPVQFDCNDCTSRWMKPIRSRKVHTALVSLSRGTTLASDKQQNGPFILTHTHIYM